MHASSSPSLTTWLTKAASWIYGFVKPASSSTDQVLAPISPHYEETRKLYLVEVDPPDLCPSLKSVIEQLAQSNPEAPPGVLLRWFVLMSTTPISKSSSDGNR